MVLSKRLQAFILFFGDCALLYLGLFSALILRYGLPLPAKIWQLHFAPFSIIFGLWLIILYIAGGYDLKIFGSLKKGFGQIAKTMLVAGFAAILIFYLVPFFKITPKTNLVIVAGLSAFLLLFWRRAFWDIASRSSKINVLFFGYSKEVEELALAFKTHPHLGYEPVGVMTDIQNALEAAPETIENIPLDRSLEKIIKEKNIHLIAASKEIMGHPEAARRFYQALPLGITMTDFTDFYENIIEKVPISIISETWFLENLLEINKRTFGFFKRLFDLFFSIILGIIFLIVILPLFALLIKCQSRGPIFLKQKRVGKNQKVIEIIKFRSMRALSPDGSAEKNGAEWAKEKDERITKIGKLIRKTRIDELPQVWNVLKGDLSFIGPRPERPEFVEALQKEIPHYTMRHLIKPGLSGWAQIRLPHGGVGEKAMEKLQYDLYYIKNRSFVLDLAIALKTLAALLKFEGR